MRIGPLRHRIEIQESTTVKDPDYGTTKSEWSKKWGLWCQVLPLSGTEAVNALASHGRHMNRFRARWKDELTTKMRLMYRGQAYNITAIHDETGKREFMVISAERGVSDGQ